MDIEETLRELIENILNKLGTEYDKVQIEEDEKDDYNINIISENPSLLIGYHGENIQALQHILKVIAWKKCENEQFTILVDVDDYKKRQEENVIKIAERKIDQVRESGRPQSLPPMSPYFRRKVHLHCMNPGFEDLETISQGERDRRHIVIKLK
jgi:spoIIIJ-associated protein